MTRRGLLGVAAGALAAGVPTVVKASDGKRFRAMWMLASTEIVLPSFPTFNLPRGWNWISVFFEREDAQYEYELYYVAVANPRGGMYIAENGPSSRIPIRNGETYAQIAMIAIPEHERVASIVIESYCRSGRTFIASPAPGVNVVSE